MNRCVMIILTLLVSGCTDKLDCNSVKGAVENTRNILDTANNAAEAADISALAACHSYGVECSEALEVLENARVFLDKARSYDTKAESLNALVCSPDGILSNVEKAYIQRTVSELKAWIEEYKG